MEAYERSRARLTALVSNDDDAGVAVPACPGWTVGDVLAHVVGLAADAVADRLEGYATDSWTSAQVDGRRGRSVADLIDEWEAATPQFRAVVGDPERSTHTFGPLPVVAMYDLLTHEHDVRVALGRPGRPDGDAVALALKAAIGSLRFLLADAPRPLRVEATGVRSWDVGTGDDPVVVEAEAFDLWRAFTGRRTRDEVRGFAWSGDPAPYLDRLLLPTFRWPDASVDAP